MIQTIAGDGSPGFNGDNIAATNAQLSYPAGIAIDTSGNIFFADDHNHRIRKIDPSGIISTIAGTGISGYNGDGIAATAAQITNCASVALGNNGDLFFADILNNRVRKITAMGTIETIAGNGTAGFSGDNILATAAKLDQPFSVSFDTANDLYIADYYNYRVRMVSPSGVITTVAGTGSPGYNGDGIPATTAQLNAPFGIYVGIDNTLYIADNKNYRVRYVHDNVINDLAGNGIPGYSGDGGSAALAELSSPVAICSDKWGNIYIADWENNRIRVVKNTEAVPNISTTSSGITVYPNPSSGIFNCIVSSPADQVVTLVVTDISGRQIKEIRTAANVSVPVDFYGGQGVYFIYVHTADGTYYQKLVKTF